MDYMALDLDECLGMVDEVQKPLEENHKKLAKVQEDYKARIEYEDMMYRIYKHSFTGRRRRW